MAKCKWCGKSGLFLSVSHLGLCTHCYITVASDIVQKLGLINDSASIIKESNNVDTIISRFDFIVKSTTSLLPYEQKGITTIKPLPSESIKKFPTERDNYIVFGFEKEIEKLSEKLSALKTKKGKIDNISKFLEKLEKYQGQMSDKTSLGEVKNRAIGFINEV